MKRTLTLLCTALLGAGLLTCLPTGCDNGNKKPPVVTLAEFNEINYGMTGDQVVAIAGSGPTDSRAVTAGQYANTGTQDDWTNPDGSQMTIIFVNNVVVLKGETNLQ